MHDVKHLEVEVKFLVTDLPALRRRLVELGAHVSSERVYERNVRFDSANDRLLGRTQLLRLRQDSRVRLTFKGPAAADRNSEAKVREELEVEVSDFDILAKIFERLELLPRQVYEKYRESFRYGSLEVVLDELPFGDFVELEGEESAIKEGAARLGLDWDQRILDNYLALMGRVKALHRLPFDDLTFENFAGLEVSMAEVLATKPFGGLAG
jgi:adenylate cyclase class 2